jgi:hypothetical protein
MIPSCIVYVMFGHSRLLFAFKMSIFFWWRGAYSVNNLMFYCLDHKLHQDSANPTIEPLILSQCSEHRTNTSLLWPEMSIPGVIPPLADQQEILQKVEDVKLGEELETAGQRICWAARPLSVLLPLDGSAQLQPTGTLLNARMALMCLLLTQVLVIHLGDLLLLVCLDKTVDLLAPAHRRLLETELCLASHRLLHQKKLHHQSRLARGCQGTAKQNVKVSLPCAVVLILLGASRILSGTLILWVSC